MATSAVATLTSDILQPANSRVGSPVHRKVRLPGGLDVPKGTILREKIGAAANDVQTLTVGGTATGGTFTVTWNGITSGPINWNSTAAQAQVVFDAMDQVGAGNVVVTGGPLPGTPLVVTAAKDFANRFLPLMTTNNSLTGTSPTITATHTTSGATGSGQFEVYSTGGGTAGAAMVALAQRTITSIGGYTWEWNGAGFGFSTRQEATAYNGGDFYTSELPGLDAAAVTAMGKIVAGDPATLSNNNVILRMPI